MTNDIVSRLTQHPVVLDQAPLLQGLGMHRQSVGAPSPVVRAQTPFGDQNEASEGHASFFPSHPLPFAFFAALRESLSLQTLFPTAGLVNSHPLSG